MSYKLLYLTKTWGAFCLISLFYVAIIQIPTYTSWLHAFLWCLLTTMCILAFIAAYGGRVKLASLIMSGVSSHSCTQKKTKVIIGGGVSSVLRKEALPDGKPMFAKSGRSNADWWYAGTPIWKVRQALVQEGKTILSHPSYASATLGGWIFTNSHGSGGSLWRSSFSRYKIEEQNVEDGTIIKTFTTTDKSKFFGDSIGEEEARRFIIQEVEIIPTENVFVQRKAFDLELPDDFKHFLTSQTYVRLIIINAHVMTAFVWEPTLKANTEGNLLTETFFPPWLASISPSRLFAFVPRQWWHRSMRLDIASEFGPREPNPLPLLSAAFLAFSFLYDNFEVFVKCNVSPRLLCTICTAIQKEFKSGYLRGRCEVRCGSKKLFLDFALTSERSHVRRVFELIANTLGKNALVSLHRGKLRVNTCPLKLEQQPHFP